MPNHRNRKPMSARTGNTKEIPPIARRRKFDEPPPVPSVLELRDMNLEPVPVLRRRKKPRGNYILYFALAAVLALAIFTTMSVTVLFNAQEITVNGAEGYSYEQILAAGELEIGRNLIRFNPDEARRLIEERLPALDSVQVKRVMPVKIEIEVAESELAFCIYDGELFYRISRNGRVFGVGTSRPDGLLVTGAETGELVLGGFVERESGGAIDIMFRLSELSREHDLAGVTRIDLTDLYDVRLYSGDDTQEDRVEIKLGIPTQLDGKFAIAARLLADEIAPSERGVLRIASLQRATFNPSDFPVAATLPPVEATTPLPAVLPPTTESQTTPGEVGTAGGGAPPDTTAPSTPESGESSAESGTADVSETLPTTESQTTSGEAGTAGGGTPPTTDESGTSHM